MRKAIEIFAYKNTCFPFMLINIEFMISACSFSLSAPSSIIEPSNQYFLSPFIAAKFSMAAFMLPGFALYASKIIVLLPFLSIVSGCWKVVIFNCAFYFFIFNIKIFTNANWQPVHLVKLYRQPNCVLIFNGFDAFDISTSKKGSLLIIYLEDLSSLSISNIVFYCHCLILQRRIISIYKSVPSFFKVIKNSLFLFLHFPRLQILQDVPCRYL